MTVASILITVGAAVFALGPEDGWILPAALTTTLVMVPFVAYFHMRQLPPEEYTNLVLAGRRVDNQFRWVSYFLYQLAKRYTGKRWWSRPRRDLRKLRELNEALLTAVYENRRDKLASRPDREKAGEMLQEFSRTHGALLQGLDNRINRVQRMLTRDHMKVQRAIRMKQLLANELGIHHRRLCDHIFRFSPAIFRARIGKYVDNWWILNDGLRLSDRDCGFQRHIPVDRALDLLRENARIIERLERRAHYLCLLSRSGYIFKFVAVFASRSSIRTSLVAYSRALAAIARRRQDATRRRGERRLSGLLPGAATRRARVIRTLEARLVALLLMQRAHPGADLHRTSITLCERASDWCRAQSALRRTRPGKKQDAGAEAFSNRAVEWDLRRQVLGRVAERAVDAASGLDADRGDTVHCLVGMPEGVVTAIHNSQWEINYRFREKFLEAYDRDKRALVVTLGFSQTLRDIVKTVVWDVLTREDRVFVVRLDEEDLGSRLMDFELREDDGWFDRSSSPQLGAGEGELLRALYEDQEQWHVYVLMDGDCFDESGHVVQAIDRREQFGHLLEWAKGRVTVFLVAEGYKVQKDLADLPDFFRDDLDAISLVGAEQTDLLLVGDYFVKEHSFVPRVRARRGGRPSH